MNKSDHTPVWSPYPCVVRVDSEAVDTACVTTTCVHALDGIGVLVPLPEKDRLVVRTTEERPHGQRIAW